jgi:tetratricopeptide (TPR) repeat protein
LSYAPDHRAYLGLGVLKQNEKKYQRAVQVLSEGVRHFPGSEQLNFCLGINYMNVGEYEKALTCFLNFQGSKQAVNYIAICYRALGDLVNEREFLKKAQRWEQGRKNR